MGDYPGIPTKHLKEKANDHGPHSLRPSPEMVSTALQAAKKWSPLGIVCALLIGWYVIGGNDGIAKIVQATGAAEELKTEISALRKDLAIEREERAKVLSRLHAVEKNLSSLCDFVSDTNGGRPNETWCSVDSRQIRIDTKQNPPPYKTTAEVWVYVEK